MSTFTERKQMTKVETENNTHTKRWSLLVLLIHFPHSVAVPHMLALDDAQTICLPGMP